MVEKNSSEKKTICLITDWYPTEENPYRGVFFKEQAIALKEQFDFVVVKYTEKRKMPLFLYFIKWLTRRNIMVSKINEEENTIEYDCKVLFPLYDVLADIFYSMYIKYFKHSAKEGVGEYTSKFYKKRKKRILTQVFKNKIVDKIDVLYCVDAQRESYTLQIVSEILNRPYVVAEHAPFPWPGHVIKDIESDAIAGADAFVAISYDKIRQVLLQNIKLNKVYYVGNLVDENQFKLAEKSNEEKIFIVVAANSFYKNYPLTIDIFNQLIEITNRSFKLMIVGYGANKGYSKDVELFEKTISQTKFFDKVEMIPEISHEKIQELYARADAFVMTSIQEGMPVSALEAACCGLPIFSTMCGGVEDYVTPDMGRIYKIVDADSFADGLKDFIEGNIVFDPKQIRKNVVKQFGKEAFVNNMSNVFTSVMNK